MDSWNFFKLNLHTVHVTSYFKALSELFVLYEMDSNMYSMCQSYHSFHSLYCVNICAMLSNC